MSATSEQMSKQDAENGTPEAAEAAAPLKAQGSILEVHDSEEEPSTNIVEVHGSQLDTATDAQGWDMCAAATLSPAAPASLGCPHVDGYEQPVEPGGITIMPGARSVNLHMQRRSQGPDEEGGGAPEISIRLEDGPPVEANPRQCPMTPTPTDEEGGGSPQISIRLEDGPSVEAKPTQCPTTPNPPHDRPEKRRATDQPPSSPGPAPGTRELDWGNLVQIDTRNCPSIFIPRWAVYAKYHRRHKWWAGCAGSNYGEVPFAFQPVQQPDQPDQPPSSPEPGGEGASGGEARGC